MAMDYTIWLAMFGNGAVIGIMLITTKQLQTQLQLTLKGLIKVSVLMNGRSIGSGFFRQFKPVKAQEFRLNMLQSKTGGVEIREFQLFYEE